MPKTRREKQAETDAKVMEAAFEGDMDTLARLGKRDEAKRAQELTKCFSKFLEGHQTSKKVEEAAMAGSVVAQGKKLTKTALVDANNTEIERRQQAADASAKEAERCSNEAAQHRAESDRIQRELKEMEDAGVNKNEALLLSWAAARDLRLGESVWNLLPTDTMQTHRGAILLPRGAKGKLMASDAATHRGLAGPGIDFYRDRCLLVQFQLRNPATKCTEPFNVSVYYKLVSAEVPYTDQYMAADSWHANWSRCHVHWSVLKLKLRCWAWLRRVRIRLGTHRVSAIANTVRLTDPVALASELWDHSAQLRMPFGPNDLLLTTFSAEYAMDHMLVPCRSLPADVDVVLRRWMYQRRTFVSRAHLESQRNGRSRFSAVVPVMHLWCDDDSDVSPYEPFYSAAPDGRFQSIEDFALWWDEHVRSMGAVEYGRVCKHGTQFDRRFTNADCVGCLSNAYHELDYDGDSDRCPQFRLGELIEAVETKTVVLKVDLSLKV